MPRGHVDLLDSGNKNMFLSASDGRPETHREIYFPSVILMAANYQSTADGVCGINFRNGAGVRAVDRLKNAFCQSIIQLLWKGGHFSRSKSETE